MRVTVFVWICVFGSSWGPAVDLVRMHCAGFGGVVVDAWIRRCRSRPISAGVFWSEGGVAMAVPPYPVQQGMRVKEDCTGDVLYTTVTARLRVREAPDLVEAEWGMRAVRLGVCWEAVPGSIRLCVGWGLELACASGSEGVCWSVVFRVCMGMSGIAVGWLIGVQVLGIVGAWSVEPGSGAVGQWSGSASSAMLVSGVSGVGAGSGVASVSALSALAPCSP